jgi:hypothetical protein
MLWRKSKQVNESHGVGGVSTESDQQGACFFGQSAVAVRETTLLPFGLESSDRSARAPLNIRASNDSRSTERRKTARSIPSGNPSRLTIRSQRTGQPQTIRKAGFDPTTLHIQLCNSQVDF